jgi:hypothetical protein
VRCYTCVIPALGRVRQKDLQFQDNLNYMVRPCSVEREKEKEGGIEEGKKKTFFL